MLSLASVREQSQVMMAGRAWQSTMFAIASAEKAR